VHDLAIIIVSTNEGEWLRTSLASVFNHVGDIDVDVVVANNSSTDDTVAIVETEFPEARVVTCENHGFGHANNRGLLTCEARYVLFLNPDTEIVAGLFAELVAALDERPSVGLIGVKQLDGSGELWATIRRFPSVLRAFGEAVGSEKFPFRASWLGERELDLDLYERETRCDWTSGSFMLARMEALQGAGFMDERFFIYCEEPDLCLRMAAAGWETRHLPLMTIIHHAGKAGLKPKLLAQDTYTRIQYGHKHFSRPYRLAYFAALVLRYSLRYAAHLGVPSRRKAFRAALLTLLRRGAAPFEEPPRVAVRPYQPAGQPSAPGERP